MNNDPPTTEVAVPASIDASDADRVRWLFDQVVPLELQDDRFDSWPTAGATSSPPDVLSALTSIDGRLVGFLGGPIDGAQAGLDAIVHPSVDDPVEAVKVMLRALGPALGRAGAERAQLWGRPATRWHATVAADVGGVETRALHQMRCGLPAPIAAIESRAFDPATDLDDLREVNNRAFSEHPDQGRQTNDSLRATMAEPWFRANGIRVHERDGRMAGFCWTKIHPSRSSVSRPDERTQPLGEIYVIGVDPDFHGQRLGAPMTAAGLHWLHAQGLNEAMLYVEADNLPAVKTYERLGFTVVRTDRAWSLPPNGWSPSPEPS